MQFKEKRYGEVEYLYLPLEIEETKGAFATISAARPSFSTSSESRKTKMHTHLILCGKRIRTFDSKHFLR